jgi:hypothetical protein
MADLKRVLTRSERTTTMRSSIKIALLALAIGGSSLSAGIPAQAGVDINIGPAGGIAFGYNDGYWDRAHTWHAWKNDDEARAYRESNKEHYYEYKHDRDPDGGWRDNEHYWDKH